MSQGRSTPWSLGMGNLPPLIGNPYFMGPYKPLRKCHVSWSTRSHICSFPGGSVSFRPKSWRCVDGFFRNLWGLKIDGFHPWFHPVFKEKFPKIQGPLIFLFEKTHKNLNGDFRNAMMLLRFFLFTYFFQAGIFFLGVQKVTARPFSKIRSVGRGWKRMDFHGWRCATWEEQLPSFHSIFWLQATHDASIVAQDIQALLLQFPLHLHSCIANAGETPLQRWSPTLLCWFMWVMFRILMIPCDIPLYWLVHKGSL